jgi:hypothetical protein
MMVNRGVRVRRLNAIENLRSMNVHATNRSKNWAFVNGSCMAVGLHVHGKDSRPEASGKESAFGGS